MKFSTLFTAVFALPVLAEVHAEKDADLVARDSSSTRYGLTLNSLRAQGIANSEILSKPMTAVVNTGSALSYIPNTALINLHNNLNANPSFALQQRYYCDCNITQYLQFSFSGQTIKVPNYRFLLPVENYVNGLSAGINFPHNSCLVTIQATPNGGDYVILGQNILGAANLVYNGKNSQS